ncbi:hypothetical protein K466DRAFT_313113 [Polyporus arcularius HHB13444]|uniref:Uncharacterized protein n=1 Tax=Polyporus arcularius HHB13444 TaxID=1314778 RepID=A0A5C3NZX7_9APHY|nr:hypothetical protein K466DRAFT_313113 [Polyporus arcularius HHB13444]
MLTVGARWTARPGLGALIALFAPLPYRLYRIIGCMPSPTYLKYLARGQRRTYTYSAVLDESPRTARTRAARITSDVNQDDVGLTWRVGSDFESPHWRYW